MWALKPRLIVQNWRSESVIAFGSPVVPPLPRNISLRSGSWASAGARSPGSPSQASNSGAELVVAEHHRALDPRRPRQQRLGPLAVGGRVDHEVALEQRQQLRQLVLLRFRVQRHPAGAGPDHPDHRRVAERPVGGEDGDLAAVAEPAPVEADGDPVGQVRKLPVGEAEAAVGAHDAGLLGVDPEAAVQVFDEHLTPT